jgi:hypothetical protein
MSNGKQPAVRARRTATGSIPGAWGSAVAHTADFEPENDGALLHWMAGETTGMSAYAEALVDLHEHCVNVIGLDPVAVQTVHDVADAAVNAAETMAAAMKRFADHYELPREFAGNGGLLPHDGRWITGESD